MKQKIQKKIKKEESDYFKIKAIKNVVISTRVTEYQKTT